MSFASVRSPPATTASRRGRRLRTSKRGSASLSMSVTPSPAASSGSAVRTRLTSSSTAASMAAPAGSARVPMSRHVPSTRPISAIEAVAAPWSMVRKACGSEVTARCYPDRPERGWSGVPGELFVELLEARDQHLDARVVGHDLAGGRQVPTEDAAEHRVEEEHRVGAERAIRPAGLEEMHRRGCQPAQLDLARDRLDELVPLLLGGLHLEVHPAAPRDALARRVGVGAGAGAMAAPNAS